MKYTWETDETDIWKHDIFGTVDDCIADAKENYCIDPGTEIVVGEVVPWEPYVDAFDILNELEFHAYDECGEIAENWYSYYCEKDKEKVQQLSEKLTEIVKQWLKENGTYPNFCTIENVNVVEVK